MTSSFRHRFGTAALIALLCAACATFGLPKARTLARPQLSRAQVDDVRTTLINQGYEQVGPRDQGEDDGFLTRYAKELDVPGDTPDQPLVKVEVWLRFVQPDPASDVYRNISVTINSFEKSNAAIANQEIAHLNELLKAQFARF
jgi:hypothetical protein